MFKVFAVDQSIPGGSNTALVLNATPAVEGCGGEVVDGLFDPGIKLLVQLPVGTYTAHAEVTWSGTPHASRHMSIGAFDSGAMSEDTGQQLVTSLDLGPFTVATAPGYVGFNAGVASGVGGQSITSASFLQINCATPGLRVGPLRLKAVCPLTIFAKASGNTYETPRVLVAFDHATLVNPCGLTTSMLSPGGIPGVLVVPPGNYSGASVTIEWGDATHADCSLFVEDNSGLIIDSDTDNGGSGITLSVGPFTAPAPEGRIRVWADFPGGTGLHTIDPATVLTLLKL